MPVLLCVFELVCVFISVNYCELRSVKFRVDPDLNFRGSTQQTLRLLKTKTHIFSKPRQQGRGGELQRLGSLNLTHLIIHLNAQTHN